MSILRSHVGESIVTGAWELWMIWVGLRRVFKVDMHVGVCVCDSVFESRETLDYLMQNIKCCEVTPRVRSECPVLVCRDH